MSTNIGDCGDCDRHPGRVTHGPYYAVVNLYTCAIRYVGEDLDKCVFFWKNGTTMYGKGSNSFEAIKDATVKARKVTAALKRLEMLATERDGKRA